jgi:hypothetical protein
LGKKNMFSFCLCRFGKWKKLISRGPWGNKRKQAFEELEGGRGKHSM